VGKILSYVRLNEAASSIIIFWEKHHDGIYMFLSVMEMTFK
jgi:hypothetical protein